MPTQTSSIQQTCLFSQDDATRGLPGHTTLQDWWNQTFPGVDLKQTLANASKRYNFGDATASVVSVGDRPLIVTESYWHGDSVEEGTPEELDRTEKAYLHHISFDLAVLPLWKVIFDAQGYRLDNMEDNFVGLTHADEPEEHPCYGIRWDGQWTVVFARNASVPEEEQVLVTNQSLAIAWKKATGTQLPIPEPVLP